MFPQSLAVLFVLALLCGLLWLARRKGLATWALRLPGSAPSGQPRQMRLLERLPLSGQHCLHLVSCAGRLLVVAVSPGGCQTVANFAEEPPETASAASGGR